MLYSKKHHDFSMTNKYAEMPRSIKYHKEFYFIFTVTIIL